MLDRIALSAPVVSAGGWKIKIAKEGELKMIKFDFIRRRKGSKSFGRVIEICPKCGKTGQKTFYPRINKCLFVHTGYAGEFGIVAIDSSCIIKNTEEIVNNFCVFETIGAEKMWLAECRTCGKVYQSRTEQQAIDNAREFTCCSPAIPFAGEPVEPGEPINQTNEYGLEAR